MSDLGKTHHYETHYCECGEEVRVEYGHIDSFRKDGKRIYYPDSKSKDDCIYACRGCHKKIAESCEGARYE